MLSRWEQAVGFTRPEEYRLLLAQALAVNGDYRKASEQLGVLARDRPGSRAHARRLRAWPTRATRHGGLAAAAGGRERQACVRTAAADAPRELLAGTFVPTLRSVLEGRDACLASRPWSAVPGASCCSGHRRGPVRLAVKRLEDVFLYRRFSRIDRVRRAASRVPRSRDVQERRPVAGANTPNRAVAIDCYRTGSLSSEERGAVARVTP